MNLWLAYVRLRKWWLPLEYYLRMFYICLNKWVFYFLYIIQVFWAIRSKKTYGVFVISHFSTAVGKGTVSAIGVGNMLRAAESKLFFIDVSFLQWAQAIALHALQQFAIKVNDAIVLKITYVICIPKNGLLSCNA